MGEVLALAGRFGAGQLLAAVDELVASGPPGRFGGWGVAYCYGTLLEVERSKKFEFDFLRDVKTDLAVVHLTDAADAPFHASDLQPFLRQEQPRPQAFCAPGRLVTPGTLDAGHRVSEGTDPGERFFLHVLRSLNDNDPVGSVTAMHQQLAGEPDQRFMLLNTKGLLVSTWREPADDAPVLWYGRSDLVRVLAPEQLEAVGEMEWEPIPARNLLAFTRQRYEAGQAG